MEEVLLRAIEVGRGKTARGKVATYIPELGKADPQQLGVSVFTRSGRRIASGDTKVRFTIQSIAKVISLAMALEVCGFEDVFRNVGMEPSGDAFNSLLKLEKADSTPHNPMINAGAIVIASYLASRSSFEELMELSRAICLDPGITLDECIYQSEMSHSSRNRAIAYLLDSKGYIEGDVEQALRFYVKMCSMSVTAESLAGLGLVLANDGVNPENGRRLLSAQTVKVVKTIMLTCGMYDGSGEFAVRVGVPSKSGVGGGILAVVDGRMGIGIFGPALDAKGNSIAGVAMLEYLSNQMGFHMFGKRYDY